MVWDQLWIYLKNMLSLLVDIQTNQIGNKYMYKTYAIIKKSIYYKAN